MSTRVSAYAASRRTRAATAAGLPAASRSAAPRASRASSSWRTVTVWLRRPSASARGGLLDEAEGVLDARDEVPVRERIVDRGAARVAEREEMAGEVAAVHRGDVAGLERAQVRSCRTSCRSGRGSARGGASSPGWPRAGRPCRGGRASRSRARRPSTAGRARCSWATCGARRPAAGSSWKLSGGRKVSSGPTKVSKKRQVRRAVERRTPASSGREPPLERRRGRPADPAGDQRARGPRAGGTARRPRGCSAAAGRRSAPAATARTSAPPMRR